MLETKRIFKIYYNIIKKYKESILSFIFLILCIGISFIFVLDSFNAKYKIDLDEEKDNIYRFDKEFNKEIKDNLKL